MKELAASFKEVASVATYFRDDNLASRTKCCNAKPHSVFVLPFVNLAADTKP